MRLKNRAKFLLRSMLYVPTFQKKYFEKIKTFNTDAIILDLEDSIPDEYKNDGRENIQEFFEHCPGVHAKILVRLNSVESHLLLEDLKFVMTEMIDGFILTKIYSADDIVYYEKLITQYEYDYNIPLQHFSFIPLIETASAVMDVFNIAKSSQRNIGLALGGEDFLCDMGGFHGWDSKGLDYARSKIAVAARAVGALPIDTPYLSIEDDDGFCQEERKSFEMGFAGCQCLHPRQISLANRCFMPTDEEIKNSQKIIEAINESSSHGSNVVMLDGNMIGPPMQRRALKVMDLVNLGKQTERMGE